MIKKINTSQLKPGMFIHDMNCGWFDHPFLNSRIKVNTDKAIEKIIDHGVREVYIDTDKGMDVSDAPSKEEVSREIDAGINKIVEPQISRPKRVPLREEINKAKEVKKEAKKTVETLMNDVRLGKQIEVEKVDRVVEQMIESIFRNNDALTSLGRIKSVDEYTFMHSVSVGVLMISFGKHLGFDYELIKQIGVGGLLHDVGKVNVPVDILTSINKLTEEEFIEARKHVKEGRTILENTPSMHTNSIMVAAHHHERVDGTGYPDRLSGDSINIYGQMAAIADVYDAMTSQRCYQQQFQPTETLKKLYEWGGAYNPELVQKFIRCVGIYPVGSLVRLESGLLGVVLEHGESSLIHPVVRIIYDTKREKLIMPRVIDLSLQDSDKVACHEDPEAWNLIPENYL